MKKWIVLTMALIFALGVTSMAFAAEEKKPGVPGLGPEEKIQLQEAKKPATAKKQDVKSGVPGLGPEEKIQLQEAKKPATVKKKAKKAGPPPGLGPEEKTQMEEAKKKSTADKMKEKKPEAAPAAPVVEKK